MSSVRVPHLELVAAPSETMRSRLEAPRSRIRLRGSPFRPGELPSPLALRLSEAHASAADSGARERQVPVELWLRAALDGALSLDRLAAHAPRERIERELDAHARAGLTVAGLHPRLAAYARLLRRGEPGSATPSRGGVVELLLPAETALCWTRAAASCGTDLERWAAGMLERAPADALTWEAAAAEAGAGLREWAYAASLALIASASA